MSTSSKSASPRLPSESNKTHGWEVFGPTYRYPPNRRLRLSVSTFGVHSKELPVLGLARVSCFGPIGFGSSISPVDRVAQGLSINIVYPRGCNDLL
jgi:hypothetical protein